MYYALWSQTRTWPWDAGGHSGAVNQGHGNWPELVEVHAISFSNPHCLFFVVVFAPIICMLPVLCSIYLQTSLNLAEKLAQCASSPIQNGIDCLLKLIWCLMGFCFQFHRDVSSSRSGTSRWKTRPGNIEAVFFLDRGSISWEYRIVRCWRDARQIPSSAITVLLQMLTMYFICTWKIPFLVGNT